MRLTASYSKKGEAIVKMNHDAIDAGAQQVVKVDVPESWKDCEYEDISVKHEGEGKLIDYVNDILVPINAFAGSKLPVSAFTKYQTGEVPNFGFISIREERNCYRCSYME